MCFCINLNGQNDLKEIVMNNKVQQFDIFYTTNLTTDTLYVWTATAATVSNSQEMNRERNSPDSFEKLANFECHWYKRNFMNFVKCWLRKCFNYLGLLVNLARYTIIVHLFLCQNGSHSSRFFLMNWWFYNALFLQCFFHNNYLTEFITLQICFIANLTLKKYKLLFVINVTNVSVIVSL